MGGQHDTTAAEGSAIGLGISARTQIAFPEVKHDPLPYSRLLHLAWLGLPRLRDRFPVNEGAGRDGFVRWCLFEGGRDVARLRQHLIELKDRLGAPATSAPPNEDQPLTELAHALWRHRTDLQERFDLNTPAGRAGFVRWYIVHGLREHQLGGLLSTREAAWLREAEPSIEQEHDLVVTRLAYLIWQDRPDLQAAFALKNPGGRRGLIAWYLTHGLQEYGLVRYPQVLNAAEEEWLCAPAAIKPMTDRPITRMMHATWLRRDDLQAQFDLTTAVGQTDFLAWFYVFGVRELGAVDALSCSELEWCLQSIGSSRGRNDADLPLLLALIWKSRPDLQEAFDIAGVDGRTELAKWFDEHGRSDYGDLLDSMRVALRRHVGIDSPKEVSAGRQTARSRSRPTVSIVASSRGRLGLLEDARSAARAFTEAGLDVTLVDVDVDVGYGTVAGRHPSAARPDLDSRGRVSLIFLPPAGYAEALLTDGPWQDAEYKIGAWPSHLASWPRELRPCLDAVDEHWPSSRWAKAAIESTASAPVTHFPIAVCTGTPSSYDRAEFGLPPDRYLFTCVFEADHELARRDPLAAVEAFQRAFPWGNEPVGLILKTTRPTADGPIWRSLLEAAEVDPRVSLIADAMPHDRVVGLMSACDAALSLHRATNNGRALAEAMALGKPVVATVFSGGQDIMLPDIACPVGFRLVPVRRNEQPYGEGQHWAAADVEHAAWHMKRLIADPNQGRRLGAAARMYLVETHGTRTIGQRYRARLDELGLL